ncbi:DUF397 domain-containing protein [Catenuloplanes japonicus]|uniref:DUF397 domain-containing protein n=1 Tax=Catenuloplanes japonicus TaxID=33876 RepID=UPI000A11011B|nr:DUF397 domain-containing protein [Catenuloplanes japonicus]
MEALTWRKSSRSSPNGGQCVEVALNSLAGVFVRDSKDPHGGQLQFPKADWNVFLLQLRAEDLHRAEPFRAGVFLTKSK